jgi:hypothetical protein
MGGTSIVLDVGLKEISPINLLLGLRSTSKGQVMYYARVNALLSQPESFRFAEA